MEHHDSSILLSDRLT